VTGDWLYDAALDFTRPVAVVYYALVPLGVIVCFLPWFWLALGRDWLARRRSAAETEEGRVAERGGVKGGASTAVEEGGAAQV
jgi:hypothetical protein